MVLPLYVYKIGDLLQFFWLLGVKKLAVMITPPIPSHKYQSRTESLHLEWVRCVVPNIDLPW